MISQIVANNAVISLEVTEKLACFEAQIKALKAQEDEIRAAILQAMEANNLLKFEDDNVAVTYIPEADREVLDSKGLKTELPDIYDAYVKLTKVKPSIRLKVKA